MVDAIVASSRVSNESIGPSRKTKSTAAVALRHTLYQIQIVLQQEQDFFGFFFWDADKNDDSSKAPGTLSQFNKTDGIKISSKNAKKAVKFLGMLGRSESRILDEAVGERSHSQDRSKSNSNKLKKLMPEAMLTLAQRERNNILKRLFVEDCKIFKEIDERIVKYIRGSSNNFEMLSMVVDVGEFTDKVGSNESRSFIVESLQTTLQHNARTAFNDFIEEQLRYIDHLKPDPRYAGILVPFKKFPAFLDRIVAIWRVCSGGSSTQNLRTDNSVSSANILDGNIKKLVTTLFAWLDRVAESKPKYAGIVLSENLYFFYRTISARKVQFLDGLVQKAYNRFQTTADEYVIMSVEQYFKGFREFVDEVEILLKRTTHADVKFDKPRDELRRTINKVSKQSIATSVGQLKDRIKKHFKVESQLRPIISEKFVKFFCMKYSVLEMIARQCYDEKLSHTSEEVRRWLDDVFSDFALPVI
uniref:Exocyst complex component Sec3 C-terminal domain-containing protein n=1 Tax=Aplanochytrium stocchinoi TaxID=215587 RepID=A0A7S3LNW4_9STRA